jgi:hypothetical protein
VALEGDTKIHEGTLPIVLQSQHASGSVHKLCPCTDIPQALLLAIDVDKYP